MTPTLCILVCHNFASEVAAAIKAEGWQDVAVAAFPARCGHPPLTWDELRLPVGCTQLVVLGRACIHDLGAASADFPPVRVVPVGQCFHLVAGETLVDEAITAGGYLITPVWLANWPERIREMDFSPEQAGEFFHDFARELLLLDTGLDPEADIRLAEMGQAVGLPTRRIPVGLDHTRPLLARLVLAWRLDVAKQTSREHGRRHARELADHVTAMDFLARLAHAQHEAEAIAAIEELFNMLFAPEALYYLRVENEVAIPVGNMPADVLATLRSLRVSYAWTPDGLGFLLSIGRGDEVVGRILVERLTFPEQRERYLNLALAMTGVCALAIENARNRKKLLEAEKMASLGILVAGVAHEINTPVGVGLTAATSLQAQSHRLALRFAERSMTQSDLDTYLQQAQEEAALIHGNLERIGHLIDTFRQVAVGGLSPDKRRFPLRACLEDVVRSLGERLPRDRVEVHIDCDPALEIVSLPGDWVSIFINLISNSIQHGFRGREHGLIDIQVSADAAKVKVNYRDDGHGMAPDALARIFDPFFTTDLQHGMGLGMHLVYNLIRHRLGGDIQCESQPGEGLHCHIEVPS